MIVGLGIDIIEIERVKSAHKKWGDRFTGRVFTESELDSWRKTGSADSRLAGRFAAKEAAMKALGVGWGPDASWHELEVSNDKKGKPILSMTGSAAETADSMGVGSMHVSISHSPLSACAVVVLEGKQDG